MNEGSDSRLWLRVFGVGFLLCYGLFISSLLTPVPYGDLTRIGRVTETKFGWREAQPLIPDEHLKTWPIQDADVLVIGDSFSMRYAWQAPLVGAGYRVATTHWNYTGPLCADFGDWIRKAGFKGKVVIVQSIERALGKRIENSRKCETMKLPYQSTPLPPGNPSHPAPLARFNWTAELTRGWQTFWNTRHILRDSNWTISPEFRGTQIDSHTLSDGCRQFSHVACDKVLVLAEDRAVEPLSAEAATFMGDFSRAQDPLNTIWMVIPNKTTVYLDTHYADTFRAALNPLKVGPDLFELAQENRFTTIDLFPANETHVSIRGYLLLGQRMLKAVSEVIPAPPAKSS